MGGAWLLNISLLNAEDVKNVKFSFSIGDKMIGVIREVRGVVNE